MNKDKVYVVTSTEDGWDCVRGVFRSIKGAIESRGFTYIEGNNEFEDYDSNNPYIIHEEYIEN